MSEISPHIQDTSPSSPGSILQRCRVYHEITLDEAAEATKIGVNYLKALEDDQVNAFASLAYLKGFLRIYATHLGLNPDDMIRLYEKLYAPVAQVSSQVVSGNADESGPQRFSWQKLALPALLLLLIIITAAILNRSHILSRPQPPSQPVVVPVVAVPAVQPVLSSARLSPPLQKTDSVPVPAETIKGDVATPEHNSAQKPLSESSKGFVVRMKVTQNGSLTVTIDGAKPQDYDLTIGDVIEWKAEKNIALDLSNAGGIEAELNGKPLKAFGLAGAPAYIVLDSDGVKK